MHNGVEFYIKACFYVWRILNCRKTVLPYAYMI